MMSDPVDDVTCDLIPLAVLKPFKRSSFMLSPSNVTCDLIPLAVLKPVKKDVKVLCILVTCDLIPLAVLKRCTFGWRQSDSRLSHVTSYRLRY